jgi:hypothetical protein
VPPLFYVDVRVCVCVYLGRLLLLEEGRLITKTSRQ